MIDQSYKPNTFLDILFWVFFICGVITVCPIFLLGIVIVLIINQCL